MNQRILCLTALFVLLSAAGCVPSGSGGSSSSSGESLSQQVARHEVQLQQVLSQVGQVEQVLPGQAEMWSQMQTMRQELNAVQGRLEDLNVQVSGQGTGELAMLKDKVARMEAILRQVASQMAISTDGLDAGSSSAPPSQYQAPQGGPVVTPPVVGTPAPPAAPGGKDTATALYEAGVNSFGQGRYNDAIISFKDFVATFPKHQLAGNAHFWQGESYYQLKDYGRAALAYQEVIAKFPGSAKMQSAMLKQGMALYFADKKSAGKDRLNELIKKYPNSPEASRAKDFLKNK